MMFLVQCPICLTDLNSLPRILQDRDASVYDCPQCGRYELEGLAEIHSEIESSRQLISAWIRRQNKHGVTPFIGVYSLTGDWFKNLRSSGLPTTVNQKLDSLLLAYADIVQDDYAGIVKSQRYPTLVSDIAGRGYDEVRGLNLLLEDLGLVWSEPSHRNEHIRITAKGWQRLTELAAPVQSNDSAFIAMWFDASLGTYRDCVVQAVGSCGYKPVIIDDVEFNDFIMNEVTRFIREARFVIADLTCAPEVSSDADSRVVGGVRGGVYWEAGMAYGLGKPVVLTCRDDACSRGRIHFDLGQYQTIFWTEQELDPTIRPLSSHLSDPNFGERLALRILATVGKGSYSGST